MARSSVTVVLVCALLLVTTAPAVPSDAQGTAPIDPQAGPRVAFLGPELVARHEPNAYNGTVTLAGVPVPFATVRIDVDGGPNTTVMTAIDGTFSVPLMFTTRGGHTVIAVAFPDAAIESRSDPLHVRADPFIQVSAGTSHTCAVQERGIVECWGHNRQGEVGDGTTTLRTEPVVVAGLDDVTAVAAGNSNTCALREGGSVSCWGLRLAADPWSWDTTPRPVPGLNDIVELANGGGLHTCARDAPGTVHCWGYNMYGQLGDGTYTDRPTPSPVPALAGTVSAAADGVHTCALLADGTGRCWGDNRWYQLGQWPDAAPQPIPVTAIGLANAVSIELGGWTSCALMADATVQCWGSNQYGQRGDGTTSQSVWPTAVKDLPNVTALAAGTWHACAVTAEQLVHCWGRNQERQLGVEGIGSSNVPLVVEPLENVVDVTAAVGHTCAVDTGGAAWCWGSNEYGQLGDGTRTRRAAPAPVV